MKSFISLVFMGILVVSGAQATTLTPQQVELVKNMVGGSALKDTYIGKYVAGLDARQPLPLTFEPAPFPKIPAREIGYNDIIDMLSQALPKGNFHLIHVAMKDVEPSNDLTKNVKAALAETLSEAEQKFLRTHKLSEEEGDNESSNDTVKRYWVRANLIFFLVPTGPCISVMLRNFRTSMKMGKKFLMVL